MRKLALRVLYLLSLFSLTLVLLPVGTIAFEPPGSNIPEQPNTWCQSCRTNPDYNVDRPCTYKSTCGPGYTMGMAACGQFSTAALLVKSGVEPVGFTPWEYNTKIREMGPSIWADKGQGCSWLISWDSIDQITDGKMKFRQDLSMGSTGDGVHAGGGGPVSTARIKELSSEYYMIFLIPGHFIALDYISDDGKHHVIDSSSGPNLQTSPTLEGINWRSNKLQGVVVFEVPGSPAGSSMRLDTMSGGNKSNESSKPSDIDISGSLVSEDELTGMPPKRKFYEDPETGQMVEIPDESILDEMDPHDAAATGNLMAAVDTYNETHSTNWLMVGVSLTGLLMIFYSVLLVIAYAFDKVNIFFKFKLLNVISFGKLRAVDPADESFKGGVGFKGVAIRSLIALTLGILLVSGTIQNLILQLIFYIRGW